jgi:hypothetical protein
MVFANRRSAADQSGWDRPVGPARGPQLDLDFELRRLVEGLDSADAFDVDERLRRALALEQSLEARIAPLLVLAWQPGVHRALGFSTREAWVRERLGMDPTRARALVRLERACAECPPLAGAWRTGALSWVQAAALLPLVSADPLGRFTPDWVRWAGRVTVRRLRDDAELAVALAETDPEAFRRTGGLPAEARRRAMGDATHGVARADREIGAVHRDAAKESQRGGRDASSGADAVEKREREIRADRTNPEGESGLLRDERLAARARIGLGGKPRPEETCSVLLFGPPAAVRLFRTALCTVRRRLEIDTGRLPTAGDALGAMLDHAFAAWGEDAKVPARHRVFARDGWRCAAPGCTSMQNLHDHHVRFRSAGGSDAPENRVTLCAFHHLRGVHAGRVRCTGRAPDGLRWQLGFRAGAPPLLSYRSGDVVTAAGPFVPAST